jgi:hypothetical protein
MPAPSGVADSLTDQAVADSEALEAVTLKDLPLLLYVTIVFESLVHLEVVLQQVGSRPSRSACP